MNAERLGRLDGMSSLGYCGWDARSQRYTASVINRKDTDISVGEYIMDYDSNHLSVDLYYRPKDYMDLRDVKSILIAVCL